MKKIKKLKLINWHFFENEEIEFNDINVITGENGTGKSTILDAIHFLQSGGTCKFNYAANTITTGRSVENYLKARIGLENKEFLRPQTDIIGHIAIEYFDTDTNAPFVLGAVLSLIADTLNGPFFYQIVGSNLPSDFYIDENNNVRGYDELIKVCQENNINISPIGTKQDSKKIRKANVLRALGVEENYITLFNKAMSFEPLQDISRFATDFLLDEQSLENDLTSIKDTMTHYRDLKSLVESEKNKETILEPIATTAIKYEDLLKRSFSFDLINLDICNDNLNEEIIDLKNKIISENKSIDKNSKIIADSIKDSVKFDELAEDVSNSESFKALKTLSNNKTIVSNELKVINEEVKNWEKLISEEMVIAKNLKITLSLNTEISKKNYINYIKKLENYSLDINRLRNELDNRRTNNLILKRDLENDKNKFLIEKENLEKGGLAYPDCVIELQNIIANRLNGSTTMFNVPQPLASYLEINDLSWQNAIEGLLGVRRFDLFVSDKWIRVYDDNFKTSTNDYNSVGVIKASNDLNPLLNSLATKIDCYRIDSNGNKIELLEPRKQVNRLLGDVICVDSIDDFKIGEKAITRDGIYFDGYSIRHLLKSDMEKPYIGQKSRQIRYLIVCNKIKDLDENLHRVDLEIKNDSFLSSLINKSSYEKLLNFQNLWEKQIDLETKLVGLDKEIDEFSKNKDDLANLMIKVKEYRQKSEDIKKEVNSFQSLVNNSLTFVGQLNEKIENINKLINENNNKKAQMIEESEYDISIINKLVNDIKKDKSNDELKSYISKNLKHIYEEKTKYENAIRTAIDKYCSTYGNEMRNDFNNYKEYVKKYNKIVNNDLIKLAPDVENARRKALEELQEHFISSIRNHLIQADVTINGLNDSLKQHPFGSSEEIFEFTHTCSKDPLLASIYRIANDTNQDKVINNLFQEVLDVEGEEAFKEVTEILTTDSLDPKIKEKRAQLVDYRNYLHYDIKTHLNNGEIMLYSKNMNSKSGGETQTPFYAMIAGAFQSILSSQTRDGYSPCSLVIFDEAFNNMDGERIKQMLGFYKELDIQLIISVPSSRFSYIAPYADNIVALAKQDDMVAIYNTRKSSI